MTEHIQCFPFVPGVLADLHAKRLRLGVISNTGSERAPDINAVLEPTGLLAQLDPALLVYSADEGVTKASPEIFERAAARVGQPAGRCLFVGESAAERAVAASAGWNVCPHPLLVGEVLAGQQLQFVRLTVSAGHIASPWQEQLRMRAFAPQHFAGPGGTVVYGLTSRRVALELIAMQFGVELLGPPDLPQAADLFLLRDDLARHTGFLAPAGDVTSVFASTGAAHLVLSATNEGLVVAVPPDVDRGVDAFHFDSARHGHALKLTPDALLWETEPPTAEPATAALGPAPLPPEVAAEFARIHAAALARTVERYSGQRALDPSRDAPRKWELHAGFEVSAAVKAQSLALAALLAALAPQAAPSLPPPQRHGSNSPVGDPASGRSDHASFQAYGYPACLVSEDFFIDAPAGPPQTRTRTTIGPRTPRSTRPMRRIWPGWWPPPPGPRRPPDLHPLSPDRGASCPSN